MKKVFFTALAMVAFSSASMANTIADEEIVKENKKEVKEAKKEKKQLKINCCALYSLAYNLAISEGATQWQAGTYANMVESNCEAGSR